MTMREYLTVVANAHINDEIDNKTADLLTALDKRNESRKGKPSKTALANEPIKEQIYGVLTEQSEPVTSAFVAEKVGITPAKANSLLVGLRTAERVTSTDIKVGKSRVKGWAIAQ